MSTKKQEEKSVLARLFKTCADLGKSAKRLALAIGKWFVVHLGGLKAKPLFAKLGAWTLTGLSWLFVVMTTPTYALASICDSGADKCNSIQIQEVPDAATA